jgi:regulator of protease activity HflC (stomatin/prohibitin superfamily)
MEDDVLARVISTEKEIQACLEVEKTKARAWIEGVRKESEEEFTAEGNLIREAARKAAEQVRDEAVATAEVVMEAAGERAQRLLNLSDETLRDAVIRRLGVLLPE